MMKEIVRLGVLLCLAGPVLAVPSLGSWEEGAPGSTHAFWDFTPGYVTGIPKDGYSARPEQLISPDPLHVVMTVAPGSTWDGQTAFISSTYLSLNLEVPNYLELNMYKEIWVDLGNNVVYPGDISLAATPTDIPFIIELLPGRGDAEFGVRIWPNPYLEKIGIMLFPQGGPIYLDYVHIDTICVPEPAMLAILGLGSILLRRRLA